MLTGKAYATHAMIDRLLIGSKTGDVWGSTASGATWTYAETETRCFVNDQPSNREVGFGADVSPDKPIVYVPIATVVSASNRLKVISRYRSTLTDPEYYDVIGQYQMMRSVLALRCERVTGSGVDYE